LTATNKDLKKMVAEGTFREDLFFRLNVLELTVPPLRERRDDIVELIEFFLEKHAVKPISFSNEAMAQLVKYRFPGNVRELEHLIQRMVTLVRGNRIGVADLPPEIRESRSRGGHLSRRLAEVEKEMLIAALEKHNWVQTRAAEALGISERVLRYKMNKAGIKK
jgi:two-component system response regulator AtoC